MAESLKLIWRKADSRRRLTVSQNGASTDWRLSLLLGTILLWILLSLWTCLETLVLFLRFRTCCFKTLLRRVICMFVQPSLFTQGANCLTFAAFLILRFLQLKNSGILRYRGCRAGRRKIPTIISSDDIRIASTSLASLRTGVVRSNLISIPLRAPPEFVHRRQLCNFALVNTRSIRNPDSYAQWFYCWAWRGH